MSKPIIESRKRYDGINGEWIIQTRIVYPDGTILTDTFTCDADADPDLEAAEHAASMQSKQKDNRDDRAETGGGEGEGGDDEADDTGNEDGGGEGESPPPSPDDDDFWLKLEKQWDAKYSEAINPTENA